jgi:predicted membrane channel-forming protein YqfA (hemolysin III family)
MKQQDIKIEEQFMRQNIRFCISAGIVCLLLSVYSLMKHNIEGFLFVGMGVLFYMITVIIYVIKGGFPLKMYFQYAYKDEFLNTIDINAYKHTSIAFGLCLLGVFYKSDEIPSEFSHAAMAVFYLGIMFLVYGISTLWQSRD